jgi:hypothetical protein
MQYIPISLGCLPGYLNSFRELLGRYLWRLQTSRRLSPSIPDLLFGNGFDA